MFASATQGGRNCCQSVINTLYFGVWLIFASWNHTISFYLQSVIT